MAEVADIIDYYANLLIVQYHDQPKAQATIELFAQILLASGILLDIQNAYDVDTAVGAQLDIIGKYVGIDRYYSGLDLTNYFSAVTYSEAGSLPSSPPRFGLTDYADFADFNYNGTLDYAEIITVQNVLNDDAFRTLIRLKIIENACNYSHSQIDTLIWNAFGLEIRPESAGNMVIIYFIAAGIGTLIQPILSKALLPKPMGVRLLAVEDVTGDMFALTDYAGSDSPFGNGLSTYAAFVAGQTLTYSQIIEE